MTTYCNGITRMGHGENAVCGDHYFSGTYQCASCALIDQKPAVTADDGLVKAIARVAHETVAAHNTAYGDYSTPPWERLPDSERAHVLAKVTAFLNNPDLHPTAQHGPAVAVLSASQRAAAYVFHGVVHAIAREQTRD
jgi:hypothetical protein